MELEEMIRFFTARVDEYNKHMLSCGLEKSPIFR